MCRQPWSLIWWMDRVTMDFKDRPLCARADLMGRGVHFLAPALWLSLQILGHRNQCLCCRGHGIGTHNAPLDFKEARGISYELIAQVSVPRISKLANAGADLSFQMACQRICSRRIFDPAMWYRLKGTIHSS